jgi:hypothetical protein
MSVDIREAQKQYDELAAYAAMREKELAGLLQPFVEVTDQYGVLVTAMTLVLGGSKPTTTQERVIRDLMADAFDFLREGRRIVLQGQLEVAFPSLRRAYESISLLALCMLDGRYADKWQAGSEIGNAEIRDELAKHALGEPKDRTRELYRFFSKASHPNRELVGERFLGDGNEFVLGAIGQPNLAMVVDYCIKHLNMWFWLTASLSHWQQKLLVEQCPEYGGMYSATAKNAQEVLKWLTEQFNHLLADARREHP